MKKIKTKSAVLLFVIVMIAPAFFSCKKSGEIGVERWECIMLNGPKITLYMYETENKYYTEVSNPNKKPLLFADSMWAYYQMKRDTMYVTKLVDVNDNIHYCSNLLWIIRKPSHSIMNMLYLGVHPDSADEDFILSLGYQFNLKK